jgi:hypothetical protein
MFSNNIDSIVIVYNEITSALILALRGRLVSLQATSNLPELPQRSCSSRHLTAQASDAPTVAALRHFHTEAMP